MSYILSISKKTIPILILLLIVGIINNCSENPTEQKDEPCPPIEIVASPAYDSPAWHPCGNFIGFNHTPLDSITYPYGEHCIGQQYFNNDSTGFWLINIDGTNKKRVLSFKLQTPVWSPDGNWIVFVFNNQIYKMPFDMNEMLFDTTQIIQLTYEGNNYFPSWSSDGKSIVYSKSICDGPKTCGVWLMKSNGTQQKFIASFGMFPEWHPLESKILYVTRAIAGDGQPQGDSLWLFDTQTYEISFFSFLSENNYDNRYPKYSPDGKNIAFSSATINSDPQLWIIDLLFDKKEILTSKSTYNIFCWSPNGEEIVYTKHDWNNWTKENGVLMVINVNSKKESQLTYNK